MYPNACMEKFTGSREEALPHLPPPYLFRYIDRELQFCPLLFFGEEIAFFRRGEAALG
jgi:hypothetical protein